jgi:plasmid stabilization system protein ParE
MTRQIKIYPSAVKDIEEGIDYYKLQQIGLSRRFEIEINASFKKIQKFPFAASYAYGSVRYKVLNSFPHIILYDLDDTSIYILRVFNTYKEPIY